MEIESITCNQCGGPLKVPDSAQYVTCNHCDTQLAIRRTESITFTEQFQEISERTGSLEGELRRLTIENQLIAHDKWWEKAREKYMVSTSHHGLQPPMKGREGFGVMIVVSGGIIASIFFVTLISSEVASRNTEPWSKLFSGIWFLLLIAVCTATLAKIVHTVMKAGYETYNNAYQAYLGKRKSIEAGDELPDSLKQVNTKS